MAISKIGRNATDTGISDSSNTTAITIDANEIITMPSQPLFEVTTSTTQDISNSTLTKTTLWDTKVHDQNSDFDTI